MTVESHFVVAIATLCDWLKISRQFFNQSTYEKQNQNRALSKLQVSARSSDWFITLFTFVVIAWSNYVCIGFSTAIWKVLCGVWYISDGGWYTIYDGVV